MFKLGKRLKAKWLKALRSGEFVQGQGKLRKKSFGSFGGSSEDKYCCLGVLSCIVHGRKPPLAASFTNPKIIPINVQEQLAKLNDGERWDDNGQFVNRPPQSFRQIANWISRNL